MSMALVDMTRKQITEKSQYNRTTLSVFPYGPTCKLVSAVLALVRSVSCVYVPTPPSPSARTLHTHRAQSTRTRSHMPCNMLRPSKCRLAYWTLVVSSHGGLRFASILNLLI